MFGKNRRFVTDEPVEFEKEPPVEVGDFRRITDCFKGIYGRIYLTWKKAKPEDVNQCLGRTGGSLQMNWLSLRNNHRLKLETSAELPIVLKNLWRIYIKWMKAKPEDVNQCSGRTGGLLHMNQLSLRNNQLKLETSGGLQMILE